MTRNRARTRQPPTLNIIAGTEWRARVIAERLGLEGWQWSWPRYWDSIGFLEAQEHYIDLPTWERHPHADRIAVWISRYIRDAERHLEPQLSTKLETPEGGPQ